MAIFRESRRIFVSFFLFGLLNNILYVIILSAAIDLVGSSTPKAVVLLADIVPAFLIKLTAPFYVHLIPYHVRLWLLVLLSSLGMLVISLAPEIAIGLKVFGITVASVSSGLGELTFLQLTHFYNEDYSLGGFSSGTGGAGLFGSFIFMILTNVVGLQVWIVLLLCSVSPLGFIFTFYGLLPAYSPLAYQSLDIEPDSVLVEEIDKSFSWRNLSISGIKQHIGDTFLEIKPLFVPYMLPLSSVYLSEYVINQGISPTLLFPLHDLPRWLFSSYRDIYVVYGFLYQLGVFISRSSINFGIRIKNLYHLSILQFINVLVTLTQSAYDVPFNKIWLLLVLIFYEGLLGGFSYVNTFATVSENSPRDRREFNMGCVSISDSLGIVMAGCINWWLEPTLCHRQVSNGRDWCLNGSS